MYCTYIGTLFEATSVNHMHTLHDCCFVTKCAKTNRPFYLIICLISLCNYMVSYNVHSSNGVLQYYHMGTNFRGWLNFVVFEGTSQTTKNNLGKIFVGLHPCKNTHRHLKNGAPLLLSSNHWPLKGNSVCCFPSPSLVHWSTSTIAQLIRKKVW